jgi:putative transposase
VDAIIVKIRTDAHVVNRPVYIALGIDLEGAKHVLGLWMSKGDESAKYWSGVLSEIRNRGVHDVCIVCTVPTIDAALVALNAFDIEWGSRYPAIVDLWKRSWERFIPFLSFPPAIRKIIYTTNAIESMNYQLRKVTKTRGHFPTDDAVLKIFYLAICNIASPPWR